MVLSCFSSFFSILKSTGEAWALKRAESTVMRVEDLMVANCVIVERCQESHTVSSVAGVLSLYLSAP